MVVINGKSYIVNPSTVKNKKYDVFLDGNKIVSFGDTRYEQYYDKFGHYKHLNHNDKQRRENFRNRFKNHSNSPNDASFWAYYYLW